MSLWVVYRSATKTQVFTGIEAETREGAIEAFFRGDGEIQQERETNSEWQLDALEDLSGNPGDEA